MISVLTLVKNRERHLYRLIEGLERSSLTPAELIVVDMSDVPIHPPATTFPVKLQRLETSGLPLAAARNCAASQASCEHLLFLDVDCIPSSELTLRMGAALLHRDALICAEVLYLGPDDLAGPDWSENTLLSCGMPHPVRNFPRSGMRPEGNVGLFWSLAFGVRLSTFERLGGFDEAFSGYGAEDTDIGFKARRDGLELLFLGGAPAFHQYHGVEKPPLRHLADIIRNATVFHEKWGFWPMEGWLSDFSAMGLIDWSEAQLRLLRMPTDEEIAIASRDRTARF